MTELYRLVYASRNLLSGSEAETTAAVRQILAASQRNNARANVTGALLFNVGAFAQVLEGPRTSVEETFERIQCDDRHGDVTVLQCGPAEGRSFANWSMAFAGQSPQGQARFSTLAAESGFDLSRLDGDAVFAMLHDLVLEGEGIRPAAIAAPSPTPAGAAAEPPQPGRLDVELLRTEIAQLRPNVSGPHPTQADRRTGPAEAGGGRPGGGDAETASSGASDAALSILGTNLAAERRRTTELRTEIDALQIALAVSADQLAAMRAERDLWVERARLLATAMSQEAGAVQKAGRALAA